MAITRDTPYGNFNFTVAFGPLDGALGTIEGGFFEVVLPSATVPVASVRFGNERGTAARNGAPGSVAYGELVLRRGLTGSLLLWEWFKSVQEGAADKRHVVVTLLDERKQPVMTWRFTGCLPVGYKGPSLESRSGSGLAIEELVLAVENMNVE